MCYTYYIQSSIELYFRTGSVTRIDVYMDFLCPYCGKFHFHYASKFQKLLKHSKIDLVLHPLAWIDHFSNGHHYSIRAALSAEIVQKEQPETLWDYVDALLTRGIQPQEGARYDVNQGSNQHLAQVCRQVGVADTIANQVLTISSTSARADELVEFSSSLRQEQVIPSTPSVWINDTFWEYGQPFEVSQLQKMFPQLNNFDCEVLAQISQIGAGEVRSYSQVAELARRPRATRRVGTICRINPLPLLIPCHRVVPAKFLTNPSLNTIGQYALGGSATKADLLRLEGYVLGPVVGQ